MIGEIIEISRPRQWYKNIVVFAALFFSKNLTNTEAILAAILAFVALCTLSSSAYVFNDIVDSKTDKNHDKKRNRPLPSGRLSAQVAGVWGIILLGIGLWVSTLIGTKFLLATIGFVVLTNAYNFLIKNIAFADVSSLSTNFMIRAVAGAYAIEVAPSPWLILGTYLVALFLAVAKRKTDLDILGQKAKEYKKVFEIYTTKVLEQFLGIVAGLLFMTYCLYSFLSSQAHSIVIMMTIPIVSFLIFRYYNFAITNNEISRSAEKIFGDLQMVSAIIIWGTLFLIGIYFNEIRMLIAIG